MTLDDMARFSELNKLIGTKEQEPVLETTIDKAFPFLFAGKGGK
ncbi:hypothetical protein ACFQ5D_24140 [Paenibacillus farraposensis]|uniref:Uncharacterized protein n=2 Tax=Bacilli TaxID=91061 RepID=A0ABW4DI26_9BACL|nr:hypothetical protein [Lacticaseibacillus mingshuiensis]